MPRSLALFCVACRIGRDLLRHLVQCGYSSGFTRSIGNTRDVTLALLCFVLFMAWKLPPWIVVVVAAVGGFEWP